MYPSLDINIKKLKHNVKILRQKAKPIDLVFVAKAINSNKKILKHFECFTYFADSNIKNLKKIKSLKPKKMLLRIPALCEIKDVIKYAHLSLNSELKTIKALNKEAKKQNKIHDIILMLDVGDLREGYFSEKELIKDVKKILTCKHIKIKGLGTNLTCYGGVLPDETNLSKLLQVRKKLKDLGLHVDIISGGNSSSLPLVLNNSILKGINQLRIGESFLTGSHTSDYTPIKGLFQDIFTLNAQIIELKTKPSYPIGNIAFDAFGKKPKFKNKGIQKRAILNIGKTSIDTLTPINKNIKILGASSDHLLVDISTCKGFKIGDKISFIPSYSSILRAFNSLHVKKNIDI